MKTRVKELRTAVKMTQQQLADLVHVSSRTIISIEKEQYSPSLMLALLVMGKVSGYEGFIAMGVGLAFAFTISMFAEIFTYMYYESKN